MAFDQIQKLRERLALIKLDIADYEDVLQGLRNHLGGGSISQAALQIGKYNIPISTNCGYPHKAKRGSEMIYLGLIKMLDGQLDAAKDLHNQMLTELDEALREEAKRIMRTTL